MYYTASCYVLFYTGHSSEIEVQEGLLMSTFFYIYHCNPVQDQCECPFFLPHCNLPGTNMKGKDFTFDNALADKIVSMAS